MSLPIFLASLLFSLLSFPLLPSLYFLSPLLSALPLTLHTLAPLNNFFPTNSLHINNNNYFSQRNFPSFLSVPRREAPFIWCPILHPLTNMLQYSTACMHPTAYRSPEQQTIFKAMDYNYSQRTAGVRRPDTPYTARQRILNIYEDIKKDEKKIKSSCNLHTGADDNISTIPRTVFWARTRACLNRQ